MARYKHAPHSQWHISYNRLNSTLNELRFPAGTVVEDGMVVGDKVNGTPRHMLSRINREALLDEDDFIDAVAKSPIGRVQHYASTVLIASSLVIEKESPPKHALQAIVDAAPKLIRSIDDAKTQIADSEIVGKAERHAYDMLLDRLSRQAAWFAEKSQGELESESNLAPWSERRELAAQKRGLTLTRTPKGRE